ncbi:hypothetical protein P9112_000592 [Eukaryota sp. TZLM1-RC]
MFLILLLLVRVSFATFVVVKVCPLSCTTLDIIVETKLSSLQLTVLTDSKPHWVIEVDSYERYNITASCKSNCLGPSFGLSILPHIDPVLVEVPCVVFETGSTYDGLHRTEEQEHEQSQVEYQSEATRCGDDTPQKPHVRRSREVLVCPIALHYSLMCMFKSIQLNTVGSMHADESILNTILPSEGLPNEETVQKAYMWKFKQTIWLFTTVLWIDCMYKNNFEGNM